jgi:hypothetical protein
LPYPLLLLLLLHATRHFNSETDALLYCKAINFKSYSSKVYLPGSQNAFVTSLHFNIGWYGRKSNFIYLQSRYIFRQDSVYQPPSPFPFLPFIRFSESSTEAVHGLANDDKRACRQPNL